MSRILHYFINSYNVDEKIIDGINIVALIESVTI